MTWVTWQQHRLQLLVGAALVAALAVLVVVTGLGMRDEFAHTDLPTCLAHSPLDQGCLALRHSFRNHYGDVADMLTTIVAALPVLAGVFLGAPLLAREFETGTYRLAWTQSITRTRWITTKLALLAAAVTLGWATVDGLMSWWLTPINATAGGAFGTFDLQGLVPVAHALFAFALGAAVGATIRRSVAAMALTLAGYQTIHYAIGTWLRPHYATPLLDTWDPLQGSGRNDLGDWSYGLHARDATGRPLTQAQLDEVYHQFRLAGAKEGITAYLHQQGLRFADYYQPASRFWTFQSIEATIYLAVAAGLLAFALRWTQRHPR